MSTQSAIQGILSPKVVQIDGGYKASVDIVNVDTINCNTINASSNAGTITISSGTSGTTSLTGIKTTSNVIVTPTSDIGSGIRYWVTTTANTITINTSSSVTGITFNYFIAKY